MSCKMCILPFIHLEVQPNGAVYPCCHSNTPETIGNLLEEDLDSIWKGEKLQNFRQRFLDGEYESIEHCRDCSYYETLEMNSWREEENSNWRVALEELKNDQLQIMGPKSIALRFSNLCNYSCRTCKPSTSTAWFKDAKFLNPKGVYKKLTSAPEDNPLSSQIIPYLKNLEHIYFAGGEPLLEKEHYLILKKIIEINPNICLSYDTNFSILELGEYDVIALWKELPNVYLSGSIDGFSKKGEYLRKGLSWEEFLNNWNRVKKECPHINMRMNFTLSIYNMFHVLEYIEEMKRLDLFSNNDENNFVISLVEEPEWLSLQSLPRDIKEIVKKRYQDFISKNDFGNINKNLEDAIKYMNGADKSKLISIFRTFTKKIDLLRGEDFNELFPEESSLIYSKK